MLRLLSSALLMALQIGCLDDALSAAGSSPQQRDMRIDDTPLFTIGDEPDEALHQVNAAVLTDDAIILAERSTYSLRFYDRATGRLLHTVGQEGEGPGDYLSLDNLQAVGDKLYTFDGRNVRVTIRDGTGQLERVVRLTPWGDYNALQIEGFFPDGSILASAWAFRWEQTPMIRRFSHELARHGPDGTFADRLGTYLSYEHYASPERMNIYPYRREVWAVGGALWVPDYKGLAHGGGSAWSVYSQEGDLVRRVTASELDIIVLAADDDIAAVLTWDELGVQTVQLRRIIERS